ncbi:unnamed protein product [marine sediment metagenome]|uniref:Uncharacterized protein n=1 Tax=marine sediment metagenome TaxID=412755 RepID=X0VHE2_9ZZZZ
MLERNLEAKYFSKRNLFIPEVTKSQIVHSLVDLCCVFTIPVVYHRYTLIPGTQPENQDFKAGQVESKTKQGDLTRIIVPHIKLELTVLDLPTLADTLFNAVNQEGEPTAWFFYLSKVEISISRMDGLGEILAVRGFLTHEIQHALKTSLAHGIRKQGQDIQNS